MLEFVCTIPGVDPATAAWHTAVHLGLTASVVTAGTVFVLAAIAAYRRSAPSEVDVRPGGRPVPDLPARMRQRRRAGEPFG